MYVGGSPYLLALLTGTIPSVSVDVSDVETQAFGLVSARAELSTVTVEREQVLSGDITDSLTELIARQVSLDGVAVGSQLGMTDIDIANPYDISPSGGSASEAELTGTPEGFDDPITVVVDLRLRGSEFLMTPTQLVNVPEGREEEAREAFTWTLDTRSLPLASQAEAVYVSGGSIYFQSQRRNSEVSLTDLSPIESAESSTYDATEYGLRGEAEGDEDA